MALETVTIITFAWYKSFAICAYEIVVHRYVIRMNKQRRILGIRFTRGTPGDGVKDFDAFFTGSSWAKRKMIHVRPFQLLAHNFEEIDFLIGLF